MKRMVEVMGLLSWRIFNKRVVEVMSLLSWKR